jgi:hypothetical protein
LVVGHGMTLSSPRTLVKASRQKKSFQLRLDMSSESCEDEGMINTAIYDADTTTKRSLHWGFWHLVCMTEAARAHEPAVKDDAILTVWSYPSLQNGLDIEYPMGFKDPSDGEVLIFNKGDRLEVWRER